VDEKGEMPMHKLVRIAVHDKNYIAFKNAFAELTKIGKEQCEQAKKLMASDMNHQDKQGKTPLLHAIEKKNQRAIEMLYGLNTDGPDSLLINSNNGWTVLHTATFTNDKKIIETIMKHLTGARKKVLLGTKDKTGRTPLHIASFKDDSEDSCIVNLLLNHGATNESKDTGGNTASDLAGRSGRRKSKEIIEETTGTQHEKKRRQSRDSKDKESAGSGAAA